MTTSLPPSDDDLRAALSRIGLTHAPRTREEPLANCGLDSFLTVMLVIELEKLTGRRLEAEDLRRSEPLCIAAIAGLFEHPQ